MIHPAPAGDHAGVLAVATHLTPQSFDPTDQTAVTVDDTVRAWIITGHVGAVDDAQVPVRCRPGHRTFVVTPATDDTSTGDGGSDAHQVRRSYAGDHDTVVKVTTRELLREDRRAAAAVTAAQAHARRVVATLTEHPAVLAQQHPGAVRVGEEVTLLRYQAWRRGVAADLSPTGRRAVVVFGTPTGTALHEADLPLTRLYG